MSNDRTQNWVGEPGFSELRQKLLGSVRGSVLELGPGRGVNFGAFPKGITWTGLEPDKRAGKRSQARAVRLNFHPTLIRSKAEKMPFEADTFDSVVASHVLCTVEDPVAVMSEILRVLRPGGCFYFYEHVAPLTEGSLKVARFLAPISRLLAGGCDPTRETGRTIDGAGFAKVETSWHLTSTAGLKIPSIVGFALKSPL